jgi:hypothetical protein
MRSEASRRIYLYGPDVEALAAARAILAAFADVEILDDPTDERYRTDVLVIRGPSYTALRWALSADRGTSPDVAFVVVEPGRSIDVGDAYEVLGVPVFATRADDAEAIWRQLDAGILGSGRSPRAPRSATSAGGALGVWLRSRADALAADETGETL